MSWMATVGYWSMTALAIAMTVVGILGFGDFILGAFGGLL